MGKQAVDFDVEVYGAPEDVVAKIVARFGNPDPVGKSFGVIKLRGDAIEIDVSLPRRERKTGVGHRGFEVGTDPALTPREALARRDFTINAIALDPATGLVVDPFLGREDIKSGVLRHVGPAFVEDPLRVLRAFQFAGRFDFSIHQETAELCRSISGTFADLPLERVWGEWAKWAARSVKPSAGLRVLDQTGWLRHFPQIAALKDLPQEPAWHPEGDVFEHTCYCVDALAGLDEWQKLDAKDRRTAMLATLAHDFGKAVTTSRTERNGIQRWTSPGHDVAGGTIAESFIRSIGAPIEISEKVPPIVANHHSHYNGPIPPSASSVRRLARRLAPANISQWLLVLRADHLGRPPLVSTETAVRIDAWANAAKELEVENAAPKPILKGRHLIAAGLSPGPAFTPILEEALEAQINGAFTDEDGATEWLSERLRGSSS